MATGTIKKIVSEKGFGFIALDGGTSNSDLFFHNSAVPPGTLDSLQIGQAVSFDVEPDPRDASRKRATNVRLVDSAQSE